VPKPPQDVLDEHAVHRADDNRPLRAANAIFRVNDTVTESRRGQCGDAHHHPTALEYAMLRGQILPHEQLLASVHHRREVSVLHQNLLTADQLFTHSRSRGCPRFKHARVDPAQDGPEGFLLRQASTQRRFEQRLLNLVLIQFLTGHQCAEFEGRRVQSGVPATFRGRHHVLDFVLQRLPPIGRCPQAGRERERSLGRSLWRLDWCLGQRGHQIQEPGRGDGRLCLLR